MTQTNAAPASYIMIGGFLGAGKSTAVLALARLLKQRGRRVGLITNDQSVGLVDTAMMAAAGFAVEEIAGGCFCCRFDSLTEAASRLSESEAPDVFIAEPVGSCTDLVATVSYPLRRIYGDRYAIAPLSVMVDPIRAERVLDIRPGKSFSKKVIYVYRKQLEEADLIVINKTDLLDESRLAALRSGLESEFPHARVFAVSARSGHGMQAWLEAILTGRAADRATMDIDYDEYAEGEALLGWLNATVRIEAQSAFDGEVLMMDVAERIQRELAAEDEQIAHLKMTMLPDDHGGHIAVLNLVNNDFVPELSQSLPEKMRRGRLIVNLRAEADPNRLRTVAEAAIGKQGNKTVTMNVQLEHAEAFRPGRPQPTWRMSDSTTLMRQNTA